MNESLLEHQDEIERHEEKLEKANDRADVFRKEYQTLFSERDKWESRFETQGNIKEVLQDFDVYKTHYCENCTCRFDNLIT